MAAAVDVVNTALTLLGHGTVTALDDATVEAQAAREIYDTTLDAVLGEHPWIFAIRRALVVAATTAPAWGYARNFPLPGDCLRLIDVELQEGEPPAAGAYELEGRAILTDAIGPLRLRYVARVTDPAQWDGSFRAAFAHKVAVALCERLTQSTTKRQLAVQEYEDAIRKARRRNAILMPQRAPRVDRWLSARW